MRIVVDQQADLVLAVTSSGLYRRPAGGAATWTQVDTGLTANLITDAVLTTGLAGEPRRIYVGCILSVKPDGSIGPPLVAWSVSGDAGTWKTIDLPPFPASMPGAKDPPVDLMLAGGNMPGKAVVYALGDRRRMWRVEGDKGSG